MTTIKTIKALTSALMFIFASTVAVLSSSPDISSRPDWIRLPELRAYAEDRPFEEIATTRLSVLAYMPENTNRSQGAIADAGYKLGNDIYVIPLFDRISDRTRQTIRASRCRQADRAISEPMLSTLYLSVGDGSERACVAVVTTVHETILFLEILRDIELAGCLGDFRFSQAVFNRLDSDGLTLNGQKAHVIHDIVLNIYETTCQNGS